MILSIFMHRYGSSYVIIPVKNGGGTIKINGAPVPVLLTPLVHHNNLPLIPCVILEKAFGIVLSRFCRSRNFTLRRNRKKTSSFFSHLANAENRKKVWKAVFKSVL